MEDTEAGNFQLDVCFDGTITVQLTPNEVRAFDELNRREAEDLVLSRLKVLDHGISSIIQRVDGPYEGAT